jgi:uncharacterized protein
LKESTEDKYPYLLRSKDDEIDLEDHYKKAWKQAKKAVDILKNEYGAKDVWIFGSLTDQNRFHLKSDIDLAEIGISPGKFYSAVAHITRVVNDFKVDLVDKDDCRQRIKEAIKRQGIKI